MRPTKRKFMTKQQMALNLRRTLPPNKSGTLVHKPDVEYSRKKKHRRPLSEDTDLE